MKRRTLAAAMAVGALVAVACGPNRQASNAQAPKKTESTAESAEMAAALPKLSAASSTAVPASEAMYSMGQVGGAAGVSNGAPADAFGGAAYSYNPALGTVSQGDVWRVKDGPSAYSRLAAMPANSPARPGIVALMDSASTVDMDGDGDAAWDNAAANERYARVADAPFTLARAEPLSTFGVDVDTASYANARRFLNDGAIPPPDAVRIEEFVNYFHYDYPQPKGDDPFSVNIETSECPWQPEHRLARIGLGGREIAKAERPACNLVFLVDVSGSMISADKLPLVQHSLKKLAGELGAKDRIAMVVYAGNSGLVLESTPGSARDTILSAIDRLSAGGSTNGGAGIQLAYDTAAANLIKGGANRVILCTDGDFNVGTTDTNQLVDMVTERAKGGVFLTVLGFGTGNLNDAMMEQIADRGNGQYAYIDSAREAEKALVEQAGGTLVAIAKDVKIQVEFNPGQVQAWRLVGYTNRILAHADFNNDAKDAGDIGAGHQVTAFYEIVPVGVDMGDEAPKIDDLKYQTADAAKASPELMTVKLRYKQPDGDTSTLIERSAVDGGSTIMQCSDDFIFGASVASFGMMLRGSDAASVLTPEAVRELATASKGKDAEGRREEFVQLVNKYASLAEGIAMKQ